MTRYAIGGRIVDSELPLPELPPRGGRIDSQSTLRVLARAPAVDALDRVFEARLDDGREWMVGLRATNTYVVRFPELALFTLSFDGRSIGVHASNATPAETIRHLFLDQVVPLALSLQGDLVLHAAAIVTAAGAAAFVGDTGEGKSTLAASFAQAGVPPLADDCLIVRERATELLALTSYPGLRLWPDAVASLALETAGATPVAHYCDKQRVLGESAAIEPAAPLRRIYVLAPGEESTDCVRIEASSRRDAVVELLKHAYRIAPDDADAAAAELARIDCVCRLCPVKRLAYPRSFAILGAVRAAVLEDLVRV
jgi:hypothetical protein